MSNKINKLYKFGEFRMDTQERILFRGEETIILAAKVFETLELLVENQGKILTKDEIMNAVWADTFVEESNLTQNIYVLRKTLGKDFIETVPRRGYMFSADVKTITRADETESSYSLNGSGDVILAERTRTQIIEEEILEDEKLAENTVRKKSFFLNKIYLGAFAGIVLVSLLGLFGFSYWNKGSQKISDAPVANANFKALTDTGDVSALAVSPNERFLAYAVISDDSEKLLRLKDLELNQDVSLDISSKVNPMFLRFSPDGNFIYFTNGKGRGNATDVYKMTRFGGDTELVAENIASEFSFSKDGKKITFVRNDSKTNAHTLFVKNLENGEEKAILKKEFPEGFSLISSPAFSPSGEKIYAISRKQKTLYSEVVSIDLKTSEETVIKTPKQIKQFIQIESTPSEDEVIVSARKNSEFGQIYRLSITDGTVRRITNDLNNYRKISVSDDGKSISTLKITNYSNLWLLPDAGLKNAKQLTKGTFGRYGRHGLEILPDGRILYVSIASGNREIWTLDINDGSHNQLTRHERDISQSPSIAPNGRHIYFVSGKNRSRNISRMDFDGQNKISITSDKNSNDLFPTVSPDEKKLYFIRQTSGKSAIMQMDLPDGEPNKIKLPENIIPNGFLKISPDGRMLAFLQTVADGKEDKENSKFSTIGIISLDGSFSDPKFFKIETDRQEIRWTPTSDAFDFIQNTPKASYIKRLNIFAENSPQTVAEIERMKLHTFIWMPNQKDLLISDRNGKQDAIMITDF